MPFHRQQLRRWAARVLLAWLFGVVMGVANACVLQLVLNDGAVVAGHAAGLSDHHDDDHEDATDNCLDFCEESSVGAKARQSSADLGSLDWLPVILFVLVLPALLDTRSLRLSSPPTLRGAPLIPIAFLRLTL